VKRTQMLLASLTMPGAPGSIFHLGLGFPTSCLPTKPLKVPHLSPAYGGKGGFLRSNAYDRAPRHFFSSFLGSLRFALQRRA
jgi:hypothetical protein